MQNLNSKAIQASIESLLIVNNQILYIGIARQPLSWLAYQVHQRINNVIGTLSKLVEELDVMVTDTSSNHQSRRGGEK